MDRGYPRPLRGCKYDTEIVVGEDCHALDFFRSQYGAPFGVWGGHNMPSPPPDYPKDRLKTFADTNMNQSGVLEYPLEMSILGFSFFVEAGASEADRAEIVRKGVFNFWFSGRRTYFDRALSLFPNQRGPRDLAVQDKEFEETISELKKKWGGRDRSKESEFPERDVASEELATDIDELIKSFNTKSSLDRYTMVPFVMGGRAMKIKPNELFGVRVNFENTPKVSKPVRVSAVIEALIWTPI